MKRNVKAVLAGGVGCLLLFGGIFGYRYFFTRGLEHLPPEVCSGAVDRKLAVDALPPSRSAEEGSKIGTPGHHFFFSCHVYADDDSILSGEAKAADSSVDTWIEFYEGKREGKMVQGKRGPVRTLSLPDGLVSVYVPCTPPGVDPDSAVQSYALVTEARTIGETRAKGDDLRQVVTDFAYALTQHAYGVGRCQEGKSFPPKV